MEEEQFGWISKDMEWAIMPYGPKFMSIFRGQQVSVHSSMDIAKRFVQREIKKK